MRGLIVGMGSIGRRHLENLNRLNPGISVLLLRRKSSGSDSIPEANVRVFRDLDSAIACNPSFAVIATPSHLHAADLVPLLRARVPCYVEKPVVVDIGQIDELGSVLDNLEKAPTTLVGCNLRFLPSLRKLRSLIASGAIGLVVRANLVAGQWLPDWRPGQDYRLSYSAKVECGGGVILDLMHEIDQARWLFGEFDWVKAMAGKFSSLEIGSEDTACILLGRKSGPLVSLNLDYVSRRRTRYYEIVGEKGTLVWDFDAQNVELRTATGIESIDCGPHGFDIAGTYIAAMREFLESVEGKRAATSQDIFDGMKSTKLALVVKAAVGQ